MTVAIRRCVLRIRRLGGWSWGADPDQLLAAATRALPRLIANAIDIDTDDVTPNARGGSIDAPVRLRVVASADELAAIAAGHDHGPAAARIGNELARQLAAAIATSEIRVAPSATASMVKPSMAPPSGAITSDVAVAGPARLLSLLAAWQRDAMLVEIARALPSETLATWCTRLDDEHDLVAAPPPVASIEAAVRAAIVGLDRTSDSAALRWLVAIATAAETALHERRTISRRELAAIASRVAGTTAAAIESSRDADRAQVSESSSAAVARAEPAERLDGATRDAATVARSPAASIAAALPFIAMVALVRCRWFAVLTELLEADAIGALIAAIAYKTCAPPELGWNRDERARAAVAALCGDAIDDAFVHASTPRIARLAGAIAAPLRAELRRGHTRGTPLLLHRRGEFVYLYDTAGMFPIAVATDAAGAIAAARDFVDPVLVSAATATPALLDQIELANLTFVTDARPGRGEPWRAVSGARLWTNDGSAHVARHAALAELLDDASELADELHDAFASRPALPRGPLVLEAIATHAAAVALAELSHALFGARETATPVLALERFASLDVRVERTHDRIDVAIPLGKRHSDLLAHGYLTTIPSWFGRVIAIHGG